MIRPSIWQPRDPPQTLPETRCTMEGGNITIMSRRAYLIFGDIEGKLDVLRVECTKCACKGHYSVRKLIETRGAMHTA